MATRDTLRRFMGLAHVAFSYASGRIGSRDAARVVPALAPLYVSTLALMPRRQLLYAPATVRFPRRASLPWRGHTH